MNVKNETPHNTPIVLDKKVMSSGLTLVALWDTLGDSSYEVIWPRDKRLPLDPRNIIVVYTRQGHGEVLLKNGTVLTLQGHCVVFLKPDSIRSYRCVGLLWKVVWMELVPTGALIFPIGTSIILGEGEACIEECDLAISHLQHTAFAFRSYGAAIVTKLIHEWLTKVSDLSARTVGQEKVEVVISALHRDYKRNWSVKDMADIAGCSQQYLRKIFAIYTRTSPKQYSVRIKVYVAQTLLERQGYTVQRVADDLGFHDSFHFSKAFKAITGKSPSQVKRV